MEKIKVILIAIYFTMVPLTYAQQSLSPASLDAIQAYKGTGRITQGRAETVTQNLFTCNQHHSRISAVGQIKDHQGQTWTVPGQQQFSNGPKATDLYNQCTNVT